MVDVGSDIQEQAALLQRESSRRAVVRRTRLYRSSLCLRSSCCFDALLHPSLPRCLLYLFDWTHLENEHAPRNRTQRRVILRSGSPPKPHTKYLRATPPCFLWVTRCMCVHTAIIISSHIHTHTVLPNKFYHNTQFLHTPVRVVVYTRKEKRHARQKRDVRCASLFNLSLQLALDVT